VKSPQSTVYHSTQGKSLLQGGYAPSLPYQWLSVDRKQEAYAASANEEPFFAKSLNRVRFLSANSELEIVLGKLSDDVAVLGSKVVESTVTIEPSLKDFGKTNHVSGRLWLVTSARGRISE